MHSVIIVLIAVVLFLGTGGPTCAATVVVASKDSLHPDRADFVCDGTDDQVEIQAALDALPEAGGVVQMLEGTFDFTGYVEIPRDKVALRGMGRSTILKHAPTSWVPLARDARKGEKTIEVKDPSQFRVGQIIGISDVLINPLVEDGVTYWYYSNYMVKSLLHLVTDVSGNTITLDRELEGDAMVDKTGRVAPGWVMIKAYGKTHLEFADFAIDNNRENLALIYAGYSTFYPPPWYETKSAPPPPTLFPELRHGEEILSSFYMEGGHHSRFHGLYIHDVPSSALLFFQSDHLLVESNTIIDVGLKGYVNVFGNHCRIIGNEVANSVYEDGINVYDTPSSVAVVSNNIVKNCRRACILINQSRRAVVTGNNVEGDNTTDDGGVGIAVVSREGTVTGNFIEKCGTAIVVTTLGNFWGDESEDYPIAITGNSIRGCYSGIRIRDANHVSIVGNAIGEILGRAAVISLGSTAGEGFIIANNQFMNGRSAGQPAIWLSGADHLITGNQVKNFPQGFRLESTAENCIVELNGFHDVGENMVRVEEPAGALPE